MSTRDGHERWASRVFHNEVRSDCDYDQYESRKQCNSEQVAYLQRLIVALLSQQSDKLVQLRQLHLRHVDVLLVTDVQDLLDNAVR